MVQEKDRPNRVEAWRRMLDESNRHLDENTIKFEWYVVEHTPAYDTGGYYNELIPEKNVTVSPYYDSEKEAVDWMGKHVADEGKTLNIKRRRLIRRTWTEWVYY